MARRRARLLGISLSVFLNRCLRKHRSGAPDAVSSDRCSLVSEGAERFDSGAGACGVLFVGPAADANRADDLICVPQRCAAGEDHDAAIVRCVDAVGGAIGLWPISERAAARLTDGQMKEADLTGEMMRPFREAPTRYWYVSGIALRPELGGTRAIRVLLGDGLSHWIYTAAITFPFQLLALASSKEGELLLARFGFYCYQKAHAMPDGVALFALDASREEFISLLKARGIHVAQM